MNRQQKRILATAANIMIIGFSAIAASTATVAWFNFQKTVEGEGISIRSVTADQTVSWDILRYDDEVKSGVMSHKASDFYLPSYDQYITDKNLYSNVILAATVLTPLGMSADQQLYVDITCNGALFNDSKIADFTSNICQFKATVYSYTNTEGEELSSNASIDTTNADTAYRTATSFFKGTTSGSVSFVTVKSSTPNKDRDNKITIIPRFNSSGEEVTRMMVYLECSYSPQLVDFYLSKLGDTLEDRTIDLVGDITNIEFRFGTKYTGSYVRVGSQDDLATNQDYMVVYEDEDIALDGSGDTPAAYNQSINYTPVEINKRSYLGKDMHRISATETTHNSDFNYTEDHNLKSRAGYNIGATGNTIASSGMSASISQNYPNDLTYQSQGSVTVENNSKYMQYSAAKDVTRFNYFKDTSQANLNDVQFFAYSDDDAANALLDSILIGGTYRTEFSVGDAFTHSGMSVTAYYTDGSTAAVETKCVWTGYNMSNATRQRVTVSYTEDGVTANAFYWINVTTGPTVNVTPSTLVGLAGDIGTLNANTIFFGENVTYTWDINNGVIASIDDTTGPVCNVYYNESGYCTITCTARDTLGNEDTTTINVRVTGELTDADTYVKVTQEEQLTTGTYLIVYEDEQFIFNSSLATLDAVNNYQTVVIKDGFISATNEVNAAAVTITFGDNAHESTILASNGKYIGSTSNANGLATNSSPLYNTISFANAEHTEMNIISSGGAYLRFNTSSGQDRFRYFKSSTYTSQKAVTLYKKTNNNANLRVTSIAPRGSFTNKFFTRDLFSTGAGQVVATFNNNSRREVTSSCVFSGYNMSVPGEQIVTVSYTFNGNTVSFTYPITITDPDLTGLKVDTSGGKTEYEVGDVFTSEGIECIASYSNGSKQDVADFCTFSGWPAAGEIGTFTITVSYTEGRKTFTDTFDINVTPVSEGFKLATSDAELTQGDHIIIAALDYNFAISKTQNSNNRGQAAVTKNGAFLPYDNSAVAIFELRQSDGAWTIYDPSNNGYLCAASSSSNYLRTRAEVDDSAKWDISIEGGSATIKAKKYSRNWMRYNKTSSLFACYASGQMEIAIYRYHGEWHEPVIDLKAISTESSIYEVLTGSTFTLNVSFTPADATHKELTFTSNDPTIATVDANGVVTGVSEGVATIVIVSGYDLTISTTVTMIVTDPFIPVTSVELDCDDNYTLQIGETVQLAAHVMPLDATYQGIGYVSSDPDSIDVTSDGLVTVLAPSGTYEVYVCSSEESTIRKVVTITVLSGTVVNVTGIHFVEDAIEMTVGEEIDLEYVIEPADASYKGVSWSITDDSDADAIELSSGHVKALAEGMVEVVVTTDDGGFTASALIEITPAAVTTPVWEQVTDMNSLEAGDQLVIAARNTNVAMGTQNGNNVKEAAINKETGDFGNASVYELGGSVGAWTLKDMKASFANGKDAYLYAAGGTSTNNYLKLQQTVTNAGRWTINIGGDGNAEIKCVDSTVKRNTMRYNSSSKLFSCYASGQQDITVYKNVGAAFVPDKNNSSGSSGKIDASAPIGNGGIGININQYFGTLFVPDNSLIFTNINNSIPTTILRERRMAYDCRK